MGDSGGIRTCDHQFIQIQMFRLSFSAWKFGISLLQNHILIKMRDIKNLLILPAFLFITTACADKTIYLEPDQPIEKRVNDLLARMSLEEKLGQMNMPCVYVNELGRGIPEKMEGVRQFAEGTREQGIGPGGGFFTLPNTILHEGTRQQAEFLNELQKIALEKTRLKIPLLQTEEGTHGLMCPGGTIFPEGLAIGSTWDMELTKEIYTVAAREGRAIGVHQLFTLVIEPNRDPRMGRNEEGYSEDPYLCSKVAEAIVTGAQGENIAAPDKVVAGLCHYPGQSQPANGMERGAMEISERMLREVFLPSWLAGIKKHGALGVMATYPAIDGVPAHASDRILTSILRNELNFQGLVLGEGGGIGTLVYEGLAASQKEAGELALKAGLDVGISYETGYLGDMHQSIKEGKVDISLIDRAVKRILTQKFKLGLFENPYVDPEKAVSVTHTKENQDLALRVAREGMVLLKNNNSILPLKKDIRSIAVIGPSADDEVSQLGDYIPNKIITEIVTALEGIKNKVDPKTRVNYVKGCNFIGNDLDEIDKAKKAAKDADIAIVVLGEGGYTTNGEGHDVVSLDLMGMQEDLLKAVHGTGTPVVLVLINGRPLSVRWAAENCPAILEAWMCGEQGGNAIADILFGDCNPSGHLSITIPRHVGQYPFYYNAKPSKKYWIEHGWEKAYIDMNPHPLYEFGFGLSYTKFEYSNLIITPSSINDKGEVKVSMEISNTGEMAGADVVQLYIRDVISTVTTPIRELQGFEKVSLQPGEKKTVEFVLGSENLRLLDRDLNWVVEPGVFEVMIGSSSEDIKLKGEFEVIK
jgi:beta-glucosidase